MYTSFLGQIFQNMQIDGENGGKKISRASHVLGVDVSLEQLAISTLDVANPMVHWLSCEKPRESSAVKAWRG